MKKGVSSTVIGIILLVIGLAILITLVIYFGKISSNQTSDIIDKMNILRGGGSI